MERAKSGLARARRCRWADVGRSAHPDAAAAGREAARAALHRHDDAGLLIVFASGAHDLRAVAAEISDVAAGIPVVGCSSTGEISSGGPQTGSVVVLALGGEGLTFSATAVTATDSRDAGARAAACVGDVADRPHQVLLLLADGATHRQADLVRGAYSVAGAGIPLVGGVAGHPDDAAGCALIYGAAVLQDAVIGLAIGSDAPLGIGVRHGWRPVGDPMLVTRTAPGRVLELDGRPAADVYRERVGPGADDDAVVLGHPLGLRRRVGEAHVRSVHLDGAVDRSIAAAVPAGALVWLMESDPASVLDATDAACRAAIAGLGGDDDPQALLLFDCSARRRFLGSSADDDIARVVAHAGDAAVAGLYTNGEIARTRGIMGFHHQTLVVLAIA
ncbi:MAG TPA: FIST N-terminal domain-containing protein [Baekduia sp.]|uniref:FIST signal transduction protein n=1 Tax=Baekduia sp. TaxID=2600305 RepID=UPI002C9F323D|nr:FIST N-terminal domain-containing protein [Baekduia sp.]HMJ36628.1 FIST N-terminal domain-containing protein [Baekduia sp.]